MKLNWRLVAGCGSPVRWRRCVFWQSLQYQDDQRLTAPGCPVSVAPGYRVGSRPQIIYLQYTGGEILKVK